MRPLRLVIFFLLGPLGATIAVANSLPVTSAKLTVFRSCVLTASSSISAVAVDTQVREASATSNFGGSSSAHVTSSAGANRRSYLRFDLTKCSPAVPSTATVRVATLRLYVNNLPTACETNDIFRVTASWTEMGLTWNTQPFGTSLNNPPQAQRTGSLNVGTTPCQNTTLNAYVSGWNVTTDVQAFVGGTATNFGWMIRDDVEAASAIRATTYATRDSNPLNQSPQLVVTYSP
jgi:hypothetical protein